MQVNTDKLFRNEAWNHVLSGEYDQAIALYQDILRHTNSIGDWNNAGTAYLLQDDAIEALTCFQHARQNPVGNHVAPTPNVGVALCCQGYYAEACADWEAQNEQRKVGTISFYYKSEAAGLLCLIWSVSALVGLEAFTRTAWHDLEELLHETVSDTPTWYGNVARYLINELPQHELLKEAEGAHERIASRKLCQATYYMAIKNYVSTKANEPLQSHLRVVRNQKTTDAILVPEYHLARHFETYK